MRGTKTKCALALQGAFEGGARCGAENVCERTIQWLVGLLGCGIPLMFFSRAFV